MKTIESLFKEIQRLSAQVERLTNLVQKIPLKHHTNLEEWLTEEQTQELLEKGTTTLWGLRKTGQVKFSKIGGRIYYDRQSILEHLKNNASK